jgi:hypothetical protein
MSAAAAPDQRLRRPPTARRSRSDSVALAPPGSYAAAAAGSLLLASGSLALPSAPAYDPWAWIIWGRQIAHLGLVTTGGPTWKPLPVIFTTLFAPFGSAAPDLWLVVARAGGIMAIALAAMLAFRLTRPAGGRMAALFACALAAAGVIAIYQYGTSVALGESEGLLVALTLLALMRHLDGARNQALLLGFAAALIRPETWPFLGLYALYLSRRDPGTRKLAAVLVALIPTLWFLPELWGSGSLTRGVRWAQYPRQGSPALARCPFCTELTGSAWPMLMTAFKVGVLLMLGAATARYSRGRPPRLTAAIISLLGIAWIVEEAVLTQAGFSGSDRYLIAPVALLVVGGAVGWGSAVAALRSRFSGVVAVVGAAASVALLTAVSPGRGPHLGTMVQAARHEDSLRADLDTAVAAAGGSGRVITCGPIATNPSEAPLVAWTLGVQLRATESASGDVLIQSASAADPHVLPATPRNGGYHLIADAGAVKILSRCG